mmetsp:Transcript_158872/g.509430  ORF Transcript_158872/g.509430 Transcript_158872/m.509430 type:complete len:201 (+) Transcript_158872:1143-1745(+)
MAEVATPKYDVALAHGDAAGREAGAPQKILFGFGQHDEVAVRLRTPQRSEDGLSMVMTSWPAKEAPVVLFLVGQSDAALHAMQPDGTEALVKVIVWTRFHLGLGGAEEGEAVLRDVKLACAIQALEHPICNVFAQVAEGPARLVQLEHVTLRMRPRVRTLPATPSPRLGPAAAHRGRDRLHEPPHPVELHVCLLTAQDAG